MSTTETSRIPHELDLLIEFVNTRDVEEATDELQTTAGLAGWLAARGLLARGASASEDELRRAVELREALRSLMLANNGAEPDVRAASLLEQAARAGDLCVHFEPDGSVRVAPDEPGVDGALAKLLIPISAAAGDGSWRRVKACRADDCLWAFYDRSRNRSGVWCNMAVCGNREKVRTYRSRATRRSN